MHVQSSRILCSNTLCDLRGLALDQTRAPQTSSAMSDSDSDSGDKVESVGKMKQRHKRELKELDAQCKDMLHTFNKKDKNAKKEVQDKIKKLEDEMKARHEQELKARESVDDAAKLDEAMRELQLKQEATKKAAEKRAEEDAKRIEAEKERRAQIQHELKDRVDHRAIENQQLEKRLTPKGLKILEIISDGHCLYRAIAHQVENDPNLFMTYRRMAEQEMRAKPDDYLPYLADEETGDMMSPELFQEYLADMIDETKAIWGGQPEVAALASALKRPIVIYRATDAPLTLGEEHGGQPLTIAWHKHYIGLGAHYNAVVPAK